MSIHTHLSSYLSDLKKLLAEVDASEIEETVDQLLTVWRNGRRVLIMGNGGSSSTASHIVNDMQKNLALETGTPLRALCLTDNTPLLMAWANDTNWENVFSPQVECWAEPGDIVIGISGSGNSMNVVNGITTANKLGIQTIGLAGYDGGKLMKAAKRCHHVSCHNMQRVEDLHMVILHLIFSALLEQARAEVAQGHFELAARGPIAAPE